MERDVTPAPGNQRDQRLAQTFVALSTTLVDEYDVVDFLTLLAERAVELLDITAGGVILTDQRGGWHPTAASSEHAELLELLAAQTQQGPCLEAIHTRVPVASADLARDTQRWPAFTHAALQAGFHAAAAVPMRLHRTPVGALTLLNQHTTPVDETSLQLGQALADVATLGIFTQDLDQGSERFTAHLQATLHHRVVVEQAKGILAENGTLTPQQAFDRLRDYARTHGYRLSELARSLTDHTHQPSALLTTHPQPEPSEGEEPTR